MKYRYFFAFTYFYDLNGEPFHGTGNSFTELDKNMNNISFEEFKLIQKYLADTDCKNHIPLGSENIGVIIINFQLLEIIRAAGSENQNAGLTPEPR